MKRVRHTSARLSFCGAIFSCADETGEGGDIGKPEAAGTALEAAGAGLRFGMLGDCRDWQAMPQPDFDITLADWSAGRCGPESAGFPFVVEGTCMNGGRVLYCGTGTTIERRFFDAAGRFRAMQSGSDAGAHGCAVASPTPFICGTFTVARVICGTALTVGEEIRY